MNLPIKVDIEQSTHQTANRFAVRQANAMKGKQVYLNTLAVLSVHTYLSWIGIESALDQSDSWQPGMTALMNIADLYLPGIGKLECLPVLPGNGVLNIPETVRLDDRIGYIAVKFEQDLNQATLLGFIAAEVGPADPDEVALDRLKPLEDLVKHIQWLKFGKLVAVRRFLEGEYSPGWTEPEEIRRLKERISIERSGRKRSSTSNTLRSLLDNSQTPDRISGGNKIIPQLLGNQALEVQIRLSDLGDDQFMIDIKLLHSAESKLSLSEGTELNILDESGTVVMKEQVEQGEKWIVHRFTLALNERFSIEIISEAEHYTENFIV
jgi:Protein of unknown function (DUF1822)